MLKGNIVWDCELDLRGSGQDWLLGFHEGRNEKLENFLRGGKFQG